MCRRIRSPTVNGRAGITTKYGTYKQRADMYGPDIQNRTGKHRLLFFISKAKKRKERNPVPEIRTRNDKTDGI